MRKMMTNKKIVKVKNLQKNLENLKNHQLKKFKNN
jgi:hypothetical protein